MSELSEYSMDEDDKAALEKMNADREEAEKKEEEERIKNEKKAKEFEQEASSRSEQATMAAINRCSSEQKDLLIKIMAKMCDNFLVMGWSMWKKKMNSITKR